MAYVYTAGGFELYVRDHTRDSITEQLTGAPPDRILNLNVDFPAGGAKHPSPVAVRAANISIVSDQQLPGHN